MGLGFLYSSWLFVGLCPFGNKFLIIHKKKKRSQRPPETKAIKSELALISFSNSNFDNKEFCSASLEAGAIVGFNSANTILCPSLRNV